LVVDLRVPHDTPLERRREEEAAVVFKPLEVWTPAKALATQVL
jgi:hypothetical protein